MIFGKSRAEDAKLSCAERVSDEDEGQLESNRFHAVFALTDHLLLESPRDELRLASASGSNLLKRKDEKTTTTGSQAKRE